MHWGRTPIGRLVEPHAQACLQNGQQTVMLRRPWPGAWAKTPRGPGVAAVIAALQVDVRRPCALLGPPGPSPCRQQPARPSADQAAVSC